MAISYIGQAAAQDTSVTPPTHAAGDLFVAFASRENNETPPDLPSGWTNIYDGGDSYSAFRCAYKVAASSSETSGTWTNAYAMTLHVYRGVHATTPVGDFDNYPSGGSTLSYPALTLDVSDGTSWVVLFGSHNWGDGSTLDAPSGYTNRSNAEGTQHTVGGHDSNGGVASYAGSSGGLTDGGWDRYKTFSLELIMAPAAGGTLSVKQPFSRPFSGAFRGF